MLTVRQVEASDRELLNRAAKADFYHSAAGITGDHWCNEKTLMYADNRGPVVALKLTNVARLDIQFLTQNHLRNARALKEGFASYMQVLSLRGIEEVIFNSNSAPVIKFFVTRFQFRWLGGDTYSLRIK